jgi:hypothetical protein
VVDGQSPAEVDSHPLGVGAPGEKERRKEGRRQERRLAADSKKAVQHGKPRSTGELKSRMRGIKERRAPAGFLVHYHIVVIDVNRKSVDESE